MPTDASGPGLEPRPGIDLIQTRWGPMFGFSNDRGVSQALRQFGEYARGEVALYDRLLAPGDGFVDVGCNIGVISKAVARSPSRPQVVAFEPQPDCFRLASANLFHENGSTVYALAVSEQPGTLVVDEYDLRRAGNYGGRGLEDALAGTRGVPCPAVRLDAFLAPRAPRPRIVKIDTEGMEAAVIRGMQGLVHDRLVISAEADRKPLAPGIIAAMQALGCACYVVFFRAIDPGNPRYDPADRHCRTIHVHLIGFAGPPPDWVHTMRSLWPVATAADFDRLWGKYLRAGAAVG